MKTQPLTRREFLRAYRGHLDRIDPNWRAALARQADRMAPGWQVYETTYERPDGTEVAVVLLCRGGPEGEQIDPDDDPLPPAADLRLVA